MKPLQLVLFLYAALPMRLRLFPRTASTRGICISSTSLRDMTSLVFLPNKEWFVVCVGAQNITLSFSHSVVWAFF